MLATTPNKRKSQGNQNDSPQFSKKFKGGATPKKPNGTPQQTPNQQRKQNHTPKHNTLGKGDSPGKKQVQAANSVKEANPSPKTKLEMFSGTSNLNSSQNVNIKKRSLNAKEPANTGKKGKKGAAQNSTSDAEEQLNRHKRRREKSKHRRTESRGKFKELVNKITGGDSEARRQLEEKVKELEKIPDKSKNCLKKINSYKRILSGKTNPDNNPQKKQNQNKQELKGAPKNKPTGGNRQGAPQKQQTNKQNQVIKETNKGQQQSAAKQKQNLKIKKEEPETSDDEEKSDSEEEVVAEQASDEDEEVVDEESSEENEEQEQEDSVDDEEVSEEDDEEEEAAEEENSEDDDEPVQKKSKQVASKNKQVTQVDETVGKKSRYVVFVGNLPYTASKEELTEHFKKAENIVDIRISTDQTTKKPRGFAYIELANEESYQSKVQKPYCYITNNFFYVSTGMITLARTSMVVTRSMTRNLAAGFSTNDFKLKDRPKEHRFEMKLNDDYATVEYQKIGNVYDLTHTQIPDGHQGKGLGKILAEKTFEHIANKDLRVKITCEFLMAYYKKNEDKYKEYVV